ncbi:hypothetical protein BM1_07200 [Bipolaris maydis]|nr:hypothetical protein BM1_07200 [Bipolaris maydis]
MPTSTATKPAISVSDERPDVPCHCPNTNLAKRPQRISYTNTNSFVDHSPSLGPSNASKPPKRACGIYCVEAAQSSDIGALAQHYDAITDSKDGDSLIGVLIATPLSGPSDFTWDEQS